MPFPFQPVRAMRLPALMASRAAPKFIEFMVFSGGDPGIRPGRWLEPYPTRWWQQGAVVLDHTHQGADFIGVLLSSSCERFRLAISFSV